VVLEREIMFMPSKIEGKVNQNNFDIIRLLAAFQVALIHTTTYLDYRAGWLFVLKYFPGVPIFFFISGFLIYQSYCNIEINRLRVFFTNRFLRLFPALYVCFVATVVTIYFSGYTFGSSISLQSYAIWVFSQLTFFQFYNPSFLRGYGVGAINGSLWTISVELQFYVLTPLIYLLLKRFRMAALLLLVVFILVNTGNAYLNPKETVLQKLLDRSFAPWISMFLLGAYISTNKSLQERIIRIKAVYLLTLYVPAHHLATWLNLETGNSINAVSFLILSCLVLKAAYSRPNLSAAILGKNDISYGVYIYHMPIINYMLYKQFTGPAYMVAVVLLLTLTAAIISWNLIERPALRMKKAALRQYS
jgi:peptidoglycan/LPS O-acetylase OafA/YrhL